MNCYRFFLPLRGNRRDWYRVIVLVLVMLCGMHACDLVTLRDGSNATFV